MVITTVVTSCIDPTDPIVYQYKWYKHKRVSNPDIVFNLDYSQQFYC